MAAADASVAISKMPRTNRAPRVTPISIDRRGRPFSSTQISSPADFLYIFSRSMRCRPEVAASRSVRRHRRRQPDAGGGRLAARRPVSRHGLLGHAPVLRDRRGRPLPGRAGFGTTARRLLAKRGAGPPRPSWPRPSRWPSPLVVAEYATRWVYRDVTTTADDRGYFTRRWQRTEPAPPNAYGFREREFPARQAPGGLPHRRRG